MEEKKTQVIININGGRNQILPNATQAVQHFYGSSFMGQEEEQPRQTSDATQRLSIYIKDEEMLSRYVGRLQACQSASEVGRTVVAMVQETPKPRAPGALTTIDIAKTTPFSSILLQVVTAISSGLTVPNFRKAIDNAWFTRKD